LVGQIRGSAQTKHFDQDKNKHSSYESTKAIYVCVYFHLKLRTSGRGKLAEKRDERDEKWKDHFHEGSRK
jgi:hypothetical protein